MEAVRSEKPAIGGSKVQQVDMERGEESSSDDEQPEAELRHAIEEGSGAEKAQPQSDDSSVSIRDSRRHSAAGDSEPELSPPSQSRPLSRSPPQSRSPSPESVAKMMESLSISTRQRSGIKDTLSSELIKQRSRQQHKYHSKRAAQRMGRPKGSKAKQNLKVKLDKSGVWE